MYRRLKWHSASVSLLVLAVSLSVVIFGCSLVGLGSGSGSSSSSSSGSGSGSGGSTAPTTAQAATASQSIAGAVSLIMVNQSSWSVSGTTVSYDSGYGLTMNGSEATSSGTTTYTLDLTFSSYSDLATAYTVSGSGTLTLNVDSTTGAVTSGSMTTGSGSLTLSGGKVTSESLDITGITSTGGGIPIYTFTGSVSCNGTSFDASVLSLGDTFLAQSAALAIQAGLELMAGNQYYWTSTGANTNTYSDSGVSMNETTTVGASDTTETMKITFNSYTDPTTGYTLTSGTDAITFVMTIDNQSSTLVGASISGGPVSFSGGGTGTVTTQTWNNISATLQNSIPVTVTGTISSDGTLFDPTTILIL